MYSLVLMAAMTGAPETPQFNGFFRDLFGGSCQGRESERAAAGGCQGCHGIFGGRIRNFFGMMGCRGSCTGCSGCQGGSGNGDLARNRDDRRPFDRGTAAGCVGSGCVGQGYAMAPASCFGSACYGSCFGSSPTFGYDMGLPPVTVPGVGGFAQPMPANYGSYQPGGNDCCGGAMTFASGPTFGAPMMTTDPLPIDYPTIRPQNLPVQMPGVEVERTGAVTREKVPLSQPGDAARGKVLVKLPRDAKLFVEGRPLAVTNGERTFVTPPLPADRDALYSFKAEYTRDGETLSVSKTVKVRAGETASVEFADLLPNAHSASAAGPTVAPPVVETPSRKEPVPPARFNARTTTTHSPATIDAPTVKPPVAADQAKITVKLPAGATLFVNGAKNDRTELVRVFHTPTLAAGKSYEYTMKSEVTRNGLPEYQEQKVEFRAGDVLTVDFTAQPVTRDDRAGR